MKFFIVLFWFVVFGCVFMVRLEMKKAKRFPWFSFFIIALLLTFVLSIVFH